MISGGVPRITIDTNCVVGLFDTSSTTATSVEELSELMRYGLSGGADIAVTTRAGFDLGRDPNEERREKTLKQLSMMPIIGSVFNLDESVLSGGDLLLGPTDHQLWTEIQGILSPDLTPESPRYSNKKNDIEHLCGHKLAGRDVFVTDDRGILRRHVELRNGPGIMVMSPAEALRYVDTYHDRQQKRVLVVTGNDVDYHDKRLMGSVTFDYSNNDHRFSIGEGLHLFETRWSKASDRRIHAYRDSPSIDALAIAKGAVSFAHISDASSYDFSSRTRTPSIGDIVVWRNVNGLYAVTCITGIKDDTRGAEHDQLSFDFAILPNGSPDFSSGSSQ